jgi:hypothetical protein
MKGICFTTEPHLQPVSCF